MTELAPMSAVSWETVSAAESNMEKPEFGWLLAGGELAPMGRHVPQPAQRLQTRENQQWPLD
jgi:hypothetical protein